MGSQLTKNKTGSQQKKAEQSSNYQSLRSSSALQTTTSSHHTSIPNNIVVVNRGPNNKDPSINQKSSLKPISELLIKPLIPFGQSVVINPDQPRLSVQPVVEIGRLFEQNLRLAAETVAVEQQKIIERIRLIEQQSGKINQQYYQEKQRRFNKAAENFSKFDEISVLLDRCESDIEQLLTTFAKLNSALPESLCLENFQPPC